jgi:hypothetical protein
MPKVRGFAQQLLGGFDKFTSGPSMPGLLPEEADAAAQRHKLQMMATLLQANQPSNMPQSGMAALGGAVQDGMAAKDQYGADAIRAQLMKRELDQRQQYGSTPLPSSSIQEYERAKADGYEGTYMDYKALYEGREANTPSEVLEDQYYRSLKTDKERAEFLVRKRAGQMATLGGVPNVVPPGVGAGIDQPIPLSSLPAETGAARDLARATGEGTAAATSQAGFKSVRLDAATRRLERVKQASESMGIGGPGWGMVSGVTPSGQELEQANSQLIGELTALTRIPGVGSQSDLEQRLATLQLPTAGMYPSVRANAIKELESFLKDLDGAIQKVEGGSGGGTTAAPKAGEVIDGYRFKGGDPSQESSWEKQ